MRLPKMEASRNLAFDRVMQEETSDTQSLRFFEAGPVSKLLYAVQYRQAAGISKIVHNFGNLDASANGYIHMWLTSYPLANPAAGPNATQGLNQVIWERMGGAEFSSGSIDYSPHYPYGGNGYNLYLYLASNIPNGQILGNLVVHFLPTFK